MAKKSTSDQSEGLRVATLAKMFEASRAIEVLFPMTVTSTIQQLQKRMVTVSRNKDQLMTLFNSLERLQQGAAELGDTALVRPTTHPLVARQLVPHGD